MPGFWPGAEMRREVLGRRLEWWGETPPYACLAWFPRLMSATGEVRVAVEISAFGLDWEALDEDISVAGLQAGRAAATGGAGEAARGGGACEHAPYAR